MSWLGKKIVELDSCDSTMTEAETLAQAGAGHGTVVTAREQTAGRGRRGRSWHAPPGAHLAMSVIVRPGLPVQSVPPITLAAGIAVRDTVNSFGARASLKWPNDVIASAGKLAGILTEMSTRDHCLEHVIVGVGINVSAVPEGFEDSATSIARESGVQVAVGDVAQALLPQLERWLDAFFIEGTAYIADEVRKRIEWGRPVIVSRSTGENLAGRAVDIDSSGALIVADATGLRHPVVAGEVHWGSEAE